MVKSNYHTHTFYSDGKAAPEEYIKEALSQGFKAIGFSEHAPLSVDNNFTLTKEKIEDYVNEIHFLEKKYKGLLDVFLSLEIDYIPEISGGFRAIKEKYGLDYVIGSVHLVKHNQSLWFIDGANRTIYDNGLINFFNKDIQLAVETYFKQVCDMINIEKPDIIGHVDKIKMNNQNRFFNTSEEWYLRLLEELIETICNNNCVVEINTRGIYKQRYQELFPSPYIIKKLAKRNVLFVLSSDAHHPKEISEGFEETFLQLNEFGIKKLFNFEKRQELSNH